jgi:CHAD domain-containing protein
MTGEPIRLQAPDGGALDAEPVVRALARRFTVTPAPARVVQRTRLDTFDRRLRKAGLALEHDATRGEEVLVLDRASGSTSTVPVSGLRWPAFADTLPPGPVRDEVAGVSTIRALIAVAEEKRRVRRLELRNSDEKTVVRIDLDESAGGGSSRPATVTVRELRGYGDQAQRAVGLLTGLGLAPVADDEPGDADGTQPTGVKRGAPALELLGPSLTGFLHAMNDNLPGLIGDIDTEFLHDFRVAVRRTRATLKLGRPALPDEMRSRWEPEFKWLGDLTTPVRDLDVYELDLPAMGGWLVAADAADLAELARHLRRRRTAERRLLLRGLRSARFERLRSEWAEALAALAGTSPVDGAQELSAGELAGRSISRAAKRVVRNGTAVTASSPAEDLHDLRKRCKELRYALEVCAPVVDEAGRKRAVADLKDLQDVLGRFQDTEVQRRNLRGFAEEMMTDGTPTEAVLAMGELIGHLDAEQDRAREEFDAAFARFTRPASISRLRTLGEST